VKKNGVQADSTRAAQESLTKKIKHVRGELAELAHECAVANLSDRDLKYLSEMLGCLFLMFKTRLHRTIIRLGKKEKDEGWLDLERDVSYVRRRKVSWRSIVIIDLVVPEIVAFTKAIADCVIVIKDPIIFSIQEQDEWPVLISKNNVWDSRKVCKDSHEAYRLIGKHIGEKVGSFEKSIFHRYACIFEEAIYEWRYKIDVADEHREYMLRGARDCADALESLETERLPWLLSFKGREEISTDELSFCWGEIYQEVLDLDENEKKEAVYKFATAVKYLACLTVSPLPMREWFWSNWWEYRRGACGDLFEEFYLGACEVPHGGGEEINIKKLFSSALVVTDKKIWFDLYLLNGCSQIFGGFKDILTCDDPLIEKLNSGDKGLISRFFRSCDCIVDAFLKKIRIKGGLAEASFDVSLLKVPEPVGGWMNYLRKKGVSIK